MEQPLLIVFHVKIHDNEDILIVCIYMDNITYTSSNPSLFEEFKKVMSYEFEMIDIGSCHTI